MREKAVGCLVLTADGSVKGLYRSGPNYLRETRPRSAPMQSLGAHDPASRGAAHTGKGLCN
jgi:hypothetical protein